VRHATIARELGCSRETLSRWYRQHPQLADWVRDQLDARAHHQGSAIVARLASLALKGSVAHAELYLRATHRIGSDQAPAQPPSVVVVVPPQQPLDAWPGGVLPAPALPGAPRT
jgi:hypothetical protein